MPHLRTSKCLLKIPCISSALHAGSPTGKAQQLYFMQHKWYLPVPVWNCTDQTTGLRVHSCHSCRAAGGLEVPAVTSGLSPEKWSGYSTVEAGVL